MKKWLSTCFAAICISSSLQAQLENETLKLWYDGPATQWVEALPLGNGRIGAMVFGDPVHEQFQLNEETVWGGSPYNNTNPKAKDALPRIRQLIFEGKNKEAQELCGPTICSPSANGMPYQTVGSLHLDFDGISNYNDYYRDLDIAKAIATTRFTTNGVTYTREAYTSFPDQVLVIRLTASQKKSISFTAKYTTPYKSNVVRSISSRKELQLSGKANDHEGIKGKVEFTALTRIENSGGSLEATSDSTLQVKNANSVTLYVSIGTNFVNYKDVSGNALSTAQKYLKQVNKNYAKSKAAHINAYQKYFNRVSLDLGRNAQADKPTDVRVKEFSTSFDPQMAALYFQFGRYLLICSSQPGGQAANLQGIWNYQLRAPWDGKYTTDINVEMNYWPAESTSLPEMHEPFLQLVKEAAIQGRESAAMYGCRGWTLHHNTDIWRSTGAVDGPSYGVWPTCNAWFCQHLWDRYLFSGDKNYLAEVYPLMRGACEFYLDFLVREPENNWLVVAPSYSPENSPVVNGKRTFVVVAGTTMDNQMVYDLFYNTIAAAGLMNENTAFTDSLQTVVNNLAPMQVGRWGQLQEWMHDWDNPKDRHRHVSHLYELHPGCGITPQTPELYKAVRKSLELRGDEGTGWSLAWKVLMWARMEDGAHVEKIMKNLFYVVDPTEEMGMRRGGIYPNLFCAHPPFQIDGNLGYSAAVAEVLVQSQGEELVLLPALPPSWRNGEATGFIARGNIRVDLKWEGKNVTYTLTPAHDTTLRLRVGKGGVRGYSLRGGVAYEGNGGLS